MLKYPIQKRFNVGSFFLEITVPATAIYCGLWIYSMQTDQSSTGERIAVFCVEVGLWLKLAFFYEMKLTQAKQLNGRHLDS